MTDTRTPHEHFADLKMVATSPHQRGIVEHVRGLEAERDAALKRAEEAETRLRNGFEPDMQRLGAAVAERDAAVAEAAAMREKMEHVERMSESEDVDPDNQLDKIGACARDALATPGPGAAMQAEVERLRAAWVEAQRLLGMDAVDLTVAGVMATARDLVKEREATDAEVERLRAVLTVREQTIKDLARLAMDIPALDETRAALDEALDALAFYADPSTYFAIGIFPDSPCGEFVDDFSESEDEHGFVVNKPGKRAREALAKHGRKP